MIAFSVEPRQAFDAFIYLKQAVPRYSASKQAFEDYTHRPWGIISMKFYSRDNPYTCAMKNPLTQNLHYIHRKL